MPLTYSNGEPIDLLGTGTVSSDNKIPLPGEMSFKDWTGGEDPGAEFTPNINSGLFDRTDRNYDVVTEAFAVLAAKLQGPFYIHENRLLSGILSGTGTKEILIVVLHPHDYEDLSRKLCQRPWNNLGFTFLDGTVADNMNKFLQRAAEGHPYENVDMQRLSYAAAKLRDDERFRMTPASFGDFIDRYWSRATLDRRIDASRLRHVRPDFINSL
jgi:hypothetical protein